MTERPILFSGPLVQAILDGRKTVTRRLPSRSGAALAEPGDLLWVRETHAYVPYSAYACSREDDGSMVPHRVSPDGIWWSVYRQGWTRCRPGRWRPSIFMHRWASRISLRVIDVRVEPLRDLTHADALREGVEPDEPGFSAVPPFARLWDEINGKRKGASWGDNPDVVRIEFHREETRAS